MNILVCGLGSMGERRIRLMRNCCGKQDLLVGGGGRYKY